MNGGLPSRVDSFEKLSFAIRFVPVALCRWKLKRSKHIKFMKARKFTNH